MRRFVTHETQCHTCEDNVVSSMYEPYATYSYPDHYALRSDHYDIDLNRLPYNDYLNGPTFEHLSEEEKQIRWMIMKARFPIFDKDY